MESGEWDGTVCLMPQGHSHETTELKLLFLNEVVSGKTSAALFPLTTKAHSAVPLSTLVMMHMLMLIHIGIGLDFY